MKLAAVAYIERSDGRLLCVWNQRYGGWSLPGGMVEEGETVEHAVARELKEKTGCDILSATPIYQGPHDNNTDPSRASHVHLFVVKKLGDPQEMELGCPVTWLTREQFLKWSPFAEFYAKVFTLIPRVTVPEKEV